jgi:transcriptional regulator with XRE-family HTH domain
MPRKRDIPLPEELEHFSARLRYARELSGLGVNALAEAADLSSGSVVTKCEKDGHIPDAATIVRLATALGVRHGWLLAGEEPIQSRLGLSFVEQPAAVATPVRNHRR